VIEQLVNCSRYAVELDELCMCNVASIDGRECAIG